MINGQDFIGQKIRRNAKKLPTIFGPLDFLLNRKFFLLKILTNYLELGGVGGTRAKRNP